MSNSTFAAALLSMGPATVHSGALMLYGQFVGDWISEANEWLPGGGTRSTVWDVRFGWVLKGQAIQDVWITPAETGPGAGRSEGVVRYGTTLRIYDPSIDAWRIIWADAPSGRVVCQIGRKVGNEIVQMGEPEVDGAVSRWVFRDIELARFRWCNERSIDGGKSWRMVQEMKVTRR
ncbi:MAG: hypothetical protein FJX47_10010 [Alphaproteobacteria bacterium]|nr:hypothetical protein [Alphaproteobacteria bacterium]